MKISFFAKKAYADVNPKEFASQDLIPRGQLSNVSSIIRGWQIAEKIDAKFNPKTGYKNGVCIYIKPEVLPGTDFKFEGSRPFVDVVDGWNVVPVLRQHPEVTAIACSECDYISLSDALPNNRVIFIPYHHCNFAREKRVRSEMTTVGVIGSPQVLSYLPKDAKQRLAEKGFELLESSKFFTRQDVINFYLNIDVQIVWRPVRKRLFSPLTIVNAASFGIPTIAFDEPYFKEMGHAYVTARSVDEIMGQLERLRSSKNLYGSLAQLCREKAENYHIDRIAKLYQDLA